MERVDHCLTSQRDYAGRIEAGRYDPLVSKVPSYDLALITRVQAGDAVARHEFVERVRVVGRVLAARNARMGRPLDAVELEDLVQDVLLVAWRKLRAFSGEMALEAWVFRIAAYELLNALRKKGRTADWVDLDTVREPAAEDEGRPAEARDLGTFLRHLAAREAEVLHLRHVDGLSFGEAARSLGVSTSSVKTHYYRGLEKLREVMALDWEEDR